MRPFRCLRCDLIFLHPPLTEQEERDFYRSQFRETYHGADYDIDAFHRRGRGEARRRAMHLERSHRLSGDVLEVGSATGYFLEEASRCEAVHSATGVELDDRQRHYARSQGLRCVRELEELGEARFDLIVLFHVLEHIGQPVDFLRELRARLRAGGAIVVEVPNVEDALLSVYKIEAFRRFYWHPAHRVYFSKDTLSETARRAGLTAVVDPLQRYSLSNHLHWATRGAPGGERWLTHMIDADTERSYTRDLCRAFVCDTLWMTAQPEQ
ncbi:MAG: class I SAM-dependent methyltransferase [Myxococcales bacterium]|nr:class I SAM-dependent methyltransferase [Myxococcales bacterium]